MPTVTVATFNCENLFRRFKFKTGIDPAKASADGFTINELAFEVLRSAEKALTARCIRAVDADVIALQEVENLDVLRRFRAEWLPRMGYTHAMLVEGNDPRAIDVAVLSRHPIVAARSYQHLRQGRSFVFSRDCLEVDVAVGAKRLTLFVNHLKSMLDKADPKQGRITTRAKRVLQSNAVKQLVIDRFGTSPGRHPWIVLGDLNDYLAPEPDQGTTSGIRDLVAWSQLENVLDRLPVADRWTHFRAATRAYRQLDYVLLSRSLAAATRAKPIVERRGLSTKATQAPGARFPGVTALTAASDHCPLAITVAL